jgi:hypothetical protein
MKSILAKKQMRAFTKSYNNRGDNCTIIATFRYDDECNNGHNTFTITGEIRRNGREDYRGCIHEDIAKQFPELKKYLKWHLVSSDYPLYYISNTLYFAGNKDHRGLLKGEKRQLCSGKSGLPVWQIVPRNDKGEEIAIRGNSLTDSEEKPIENFSCEWEEVWIVGEGKERELDNARNAAIWLDATDDELILPGLKERLQDRLPKLMEEFQHDVEELGFTY